MQTSSRIWRPSCNFGAAGHLQLLHPSVTSQLFPTISRNWPPYHPSSKLWITIFTQLPSAVRWLLYIVNHPLYLSVDYLSVIHCKSLITHQNFSVLFFDHECKSNRSAGLTLNCPMGINTVFWIWIWRTAGRTEANYCIQYIKTNGSITIGAVLQYLLLLVVVIVVIVAVVIENWERFFSTQHYMTLCVHDTQHYMSIIYYQSLILEIQTLN